MSLHDHWDHIYATRAPDEVSWYSAHLAASLQLIERTPVSRHSAIIDVGGGQSTLVDDLLARGFADLTVLDISEKAIDATQKRLGDGAGRVHWITADITRVDLEPLRYDLWHDRAVFHFLTQPEHRRAYVRQVMRAVRRGGHVIVSTFGPEGPTRCSGLDVVRYDAEGLHQEFGAPFRLIESSKQMHRTPSGTVQQFLICYCRVE